MANIVSIVGRPNVGKSTLFNRLVKKRQAIVDEISGVTRDRIYGRTFWNGKEFSVIDTGGYATNTDDVFEAEIRKQALIAIEESSVVLFIVDVLTGVTDFDLDIASILRKSDKKVFLVVNKVDTGNRLFDAAEFYSLGLGEPYNISSINGSGTGELLDELVKHLEDDVIEDETVLPKFTIVGKPNVGKSSLTNALLDDDRNIVTDTPGTTRDSISSTYNKFGFKFNLIDTAGLRKKTKVNEDLEFYSVMRAIRAIENSDVCILLIDATLGVEAQDMNIFHLIEKNRKGCVIVINKWDLVEKENNTMKEYKAVVEKRIEPFKDVPILFISVINKQRIFDVLKTAMEVYTNKSSKISTSKLNEIMLPEIERYPPPAIKGKHIKIKYITQLPTISPNFAFFCNHPQYIKAPYKRFLENKLRQHFTLTGVPIGIAIREK